MRCTAVIFALAGAVACNGDNGDTDAGTPDGPPTTNEDTATLCQDGKDNDGDGKKDCADPDCAAFVFCADAGPEDGPLVDQPVADAPRPGCPQPCAADQVCLDHKCTTTGPTKACGTDTYPAVLPASGVLYVDGSYSGMSTGSQSQPYTSIVQALDALNTWGADAGPRPTTIAVAQGKYAEDLNIQGSVNIVCRCPQGAGAGIIAGKIKADNTTSSDWTVIIDGCTVQPPGFNGSAATCDDKKTLNPRGISVSGKHPVALLLHQAVVQGFCAGVYYSTDSTPPTPVCVSHSLLTTNVEGMRAARATKSLSSAQTWPEIWTTHCKGITQSVGVELSRVENNAAGVVGEGGAREVHLRGNIVAKNDLAGTASGFPGMGVYLGNAVDVVLDQNVIRHNAAQGVGIINLQTLTGAKVALSGNTVEANHLAGIQIERLQVSQPVALKQNVVTGTKKGAGEHGDGIVVTLGDGTTSFDVTIQGNSVKDSARNGILLDGVGGTVDGNTITGSGKHGLVLQKSSATAGSNTFSGNVSGDEANYSTPVEKVSTLPEPLP